MKLKKIFATLLMVSISWLTTQGQIRHPVKWAYAAKKINATEATILIKATIQPGWHIYSVNQPSGGPIKTSFEFDAQPDYALIGRLIEPKPVVKYEKTFEMNVLYFQRSVVFSQKIKLIRPGSIKVTGKLGYMVCNDHECLPPEEVDFTIPVN